MQLSFSACQKYLLSPRSWFLHYLLRLRPVDTGSALIFGAALDCGFNFLLEYKKDPLLLNKITGTSNDFIFSMDTVILLAKEAFDKEFCSVEPSSIKFSKADADTTSLPKDFELTNASKPSAPLAWYCLLFKGHILIEEYAAQVLPRIQEVYEIQREISLKNELGDTFTGIIDLIAKIDDKVWIVDNKSSSIKYAQDSVANSEQLASYYEAMRSEYKLDGACYIVVPKKLRKVKLPRVEIEFIFGSINEELIDKTFQDYEKVLDGIKNARFECTREQRDGCCSAPWGCSFQRYCQSNGQDLTGLKYTEPTKR